MIIFFFESLELLLETWNLACILYLRLTTDQTEQVLNYSKFKEVILVQSF